MEEKKVIITTELVVMGVMVLIIGTVIKVLAAGI